MKKFIFAVAFMLIFVCDGLSKEWNGIIPSISRRMDVEKILGKSESGNLEFGYYKSRDYRITIDYFRKNITDEVSKDLVTAIWVYPKKKLIISDVKEDLLEFRKETGKSHVLGLAFYVNDNEGFTIQVQKPHDAIQELVTAFIYYTPFNLTN